MNPKRKRRWSEQENDDVRRLYADGCIDLLASRLGRSRQAVKHRAIELGLTGISFNNRGCTSPVGTEILRRGSNAYVMVKVVGGDGIHRWVRKHHLVWRVAHGTFPPAGSRLMFKDGDRCNVAIDNLELIENVAAARRLNDMRHDAPALQELIRLLKQVKEKIREHEDDRRCARPPIQVAGPA